MNRSVIFHNANMLVKAGYTRSEAMKKAWALAKLPEISEKVKGTAIKSTRQTALEHLTKYSPADVAFRIAAQPTNPADIHAVGVIATVKGKGSFLIGYLPKELARSISELLRAGMQVITSGTVTGGYEPYMNYGARINLKFA